MLLSIIIAVYNDLDGLDWVLKSIENASFEFNDFEVVIVDDGSTVSYDKLLLSVKLKYKYIKQENGRQGKARNRGIKESKGEYLWFVDADDCVTKDSLFDIFQALNNLKQKDIYYFNAITNGIVLKSSCIECEKDTILLGQVNNKFTVAPWNKIYRKEFLIENNIWFIEQKKYEDLYFVMLATIKAKEFHYEPKIIYEYIYNPTSTTKVHNNTVLNIFDVLDELVGQFKINKIDEDIVNRTIFVHGIKYTIIRIFETKKFRFIFSILQNIVFIKYLKELNINQLSIKERFFIKALRLLIGIIK